MVGPYFLTHLRRSGVLFGGSLGALEAPKHQYYEGSVTATSILCEDSAYIVAGGPRALLLKKAVFLFLRFPGLGGSPSRIWAAFFAYLSAFLLDFNKLYETFIKNEARCRQSEKLYSILSTLTKRALWTT